MMWRSLTVTSEDRRNELILFYVEDMEPVGMSLEEFYDKYENDRDAWHAPMVALEQRANASFALSEPDSSQWKTIPVSAKRDY